MNKSTRKIKSAIATFLVVLISIESFGAIVSDNDGSAFITKVEFDSLKNTFQSQLDDYNTKIDAKLDEAISSYLAGVAVKAKRDLVSIINNINDKTTYEKGWFPMCKSFTKVTTKEPVNGQLALQILFYGSGSGGNGASGWRGGLALSYNLQSSDGQVRDTLIYKDIPSTKTDGLYYVFKNNTNGGFKTYSNKYVNMSYKELLAGVWFGYSNTGEGGMFNRPRDHRPAGWTVPTMRNTQPFWTAMSANASVTIRTFNADGTAGPDGTVTGIYCQWVPSYEATDTAQIWPIMGSCSSSNDIVALCEDDYAKMVVSSDLKEYAAGYKGYALSTLWGVQKQYGTSNGALGSNFNFYYNYHPYEKIAMTDLVVSEISTEMNNQKYQFYCGLPICKITDDGVVKMELKFHSASGNNIKYAIRPEPFKNDSSYINDETLNIRKADGTVITNYEVNDNTTLQLQLDVKKGTELWIKTYDANNDTGYTGVETISISEEFS